MRRSRKYVKKNLCANLNRKEKTSKPRSRLGVDLRKFYFPKMTVLEKCELAAI